MSGGDSYEDQRIKEINESGGGSKTLRYATNNNYNMPSYNTAVDTSLIHNEFDVYGVQQNALIKEAHTNFNNFIGGDEKMQDRAYRTNEENNKLEELSNKLKSSYIKIFINI